MYVYIKDNELKFSVNKPAACSCFIFMIPEKILLKERLIGDLVRLKKFLSLGSIKSKAPLLKTTYEFAILSARNSVRLAYNCNRRINQNVIIRKSEKRCYENFV